MTERGWLEWVLPCVPGTACTGPGSRRVALGPQPLGPLRPPQGPTLWDSRLLSWGLSVLIRELGP